MYRSLSLIVIDASASVVICIFENIEIQLRNQWNDFPKIFSYAPFRIFRCTEVPSEWASRQLAALRAQQQMLLKRVVLLLIIGVAFATIWSADILHSYGIYILAAIGPLAVKDRNLLWGAVIITILSFTFAFYALRGVFSWWWMKRYSRELLEWLFRKFSSGKTEIGKNGRSTVIG